MKNKRKRESSRRSDEINNVAQHELGKASELNRKKKKITYSSKGFSAHRGQALRSMKHVVPPEGFRLAARSRTYNNGAYDDWKCYWHPTVHGDRSTADDKVEFCLNDGGSIVMYPGLVRDCSLIKQEMEEYKNYRHYHIQGMHREPRVHVLFSSHSQARKCDDLKAAKIPGYVYHNIKMQALPLTDVPYVKQVAFDLGHKFGTPNGEWATGIDCLIYRSCADGINWHADDTQEEDTVLCLVVHSEKDARTLCIQPKNAPVDGDYQIELFPETGDAYTMNGESQKTTVHAVLKTKDETGKRFAIVMRSGKEEFVDEDSKFDAISDLAPTNRTDNYTFGNHLAEGRLYSRASLLELKGHQLDRRGISGRLGIGCDAIIVSRVDSRLGEVDMFNWLTYYSEPIQGSRCLFESFQWGLPVRVFRKGGQNANSPHKPSHVVGSEKYRYDGVYYVISASDADKTPLDRLTSDSRNARRFMLLRSPCSEGSLYGISPVSRGSSDIQDSSSPSWHPIVTNHLRVDEIIDEDEHEWLTNSLEINGLPLLHQSQLGVLASALSQLANPRSRNNHQAFVTAPSLQYNIESEIFGCSIAV